jgi:quercetin dioxygenase-like cupin family protein
VRNFLVLRKRFVLLATLVVAGVAAVAAYAALPARDVAPSSVPLGTLAGQTSVNVLSVDSFTRAIKQAHGTNAILQRTHFAPGQSTGWHTHPGPNLVLVVGGSITLTDEHCNVTTYADGQGFATGLKVHLAVAGPQGGDFYALYFLPADATVLRTPPAGQSATPPVCAHRGTTAATDHGNSGAATEAQRSSSTSTTQTSSPGKSGSGPGHNK